MNTSHHKLHRQAVWGLVVMTLFLATGCAKFDLRRKIPWSDEVPDDPASPTKVVAVWNEAVLHQTGKPAMRGFGGRLFFHGQGKTDAIRVDGDVVVYAFDETDGNEAKVTPDRKFVFPAANLERHRVESKMGHVYDFWIPWDEANGDQRKISLVVRFMPKAGSVVVSRQDKQILPGKLPDLDRPASLAQGSKSWAGGASPVRAVNYDAPLAAEGTRPLQAFHKQRGMVTTTIPISGRSGNRPPRSVARERSLPTIMRGRAAPLGQTQQAFRDAALNPTANQAARQIGRSSTRFPHARSRVLGAPIGRLDRGRPLWQLPPAASPYASRS